MSRILIVAALGFLLSCASPVPPIPGYWTEAQKRCGGDCQVRYTACMENDIRPDYLLISPRRDACRKMLRECYDACERK
jgi:hypothetical protein